MGALPIIAGAYLVAQQTNGTPEELHPFVNRFCVLCLTSPTSHDVAEAFSTAYFTAFENVITAAVKLGSTEVTKLDGTSPTVTVDGAHFGTAFGGPLVVRFPWTLAFGITWQTAIRGRSTRGRSYIPGVDGSQVLDSGTRPLTALAITELQAAGDALIANLAAATPAMALEVLSIKHGSIADVVASRANPNVVEQRRRYERVAHR